MLKCFVYFFALQGGDLLCEEHITGPPPLLLQWVKTEHALVMLFNNGTLQVWKHLQVSSLKQGEWKGLSNGRILALLQVNFYTDHTKIILCKSSDDSYLLTYISRERVSYTYLLSMLTDMGCTSELRHRLRYIVQLLQHHADA